MILSEIMNKDVAKTEIGTTVLEASKIMAEKKISYILVTTNSSLAGILTEDDIVRKVVAEGRDASKTKVEDIMIKEVIHLPPDKTLEEAAAVMSEHKIKKIPVVEGSMLLGIVTAAEMVAAEPKIVEHLGELVIFAKKQQRMAG